MISLSKNNIRTLIAGLAIILLTNAIVFAGVAYNRSGEPESQVILTERELRLPFSYQMNTENTGISLQLQYRVKGSSYGGYIYGYYSGNIDWLDENKLASLGMDVTRPIKKDVDGFNYRHRQDKEVILVMEYDGSAYQDVLKEAEKSEKPEDILYEQNSASRLFVIDSGLEQQALREKYPDSSKYILQKGVIGMMVDDVETDSPKWVGYVKSLSNTHIHVPLTGHKVLEPLLAEDRHNWREDPPRFSVKMNIGKRLEPWVEEVKRLENE